MKKRVSLLISILLVLTLLVVGCSKGSSNIDNGQAGDNVEEIPSTRLR